MHLQIINACVMHVTSRTFCWTLKPVCFLQKPLSIHPGLKDATGNLLGALDNDPTSLYRNSEPPIKFVHSALRYSFIYSLGHLLIDSITKISE